MSGGRGSEVRVCAEGMGGGEDLDLGPRCRTETGSVTQFQDSQLVLTDEHVPGPVLKELFTLNLFHLYPYLMQCEPRVSILQTGDPTCMNYTRPRPHS